MNYDRTEIPAAYGKARALAPKTRRLRQGLLSVHVDRADISLVIDLGCGTGRFSELLAAHFGVQVIVPPGCRPSGPPCAAGESRVGLLRAVYMRRPDRLTVPAYAPRPQGKGSAAGTPGPHSTTLT